MPADHGQLVKSRQKQGLSGLGGRHRLQARRLIKRAALGAWVRRDSIHYTQTAKRWEGIDRSRNALKGAYPSNADCSSFATWLLWVVLVNHYGLTRDIANGTRWQAGYTGTLVGHGVRVKHRLNWRRGDLIFYGDPFGSTGHVAVYIGFGLVISHGSEGGPYKISWAYRRDFHSCRRYI